MDVFDYMKLCSEWCTLYRRKYFNFFFAPAKRTNNKLTAHSSVTTISHHHCRHQYHHESIACCRLLHVHCRHHQFCIWVSKFVPQYLRLILFFNLGWSARQANAVHFLYFGTFLFCHSLLPAGAWEFILPLCIRADVYAHITYELWHACQVYILNIYRIHLF